MLTIGLTGGVGSGKSTVASMLAARGAAVVDADRLVASLYGAGLECTRAIAARFGPRVLAPDGSVDRKILSTLVLADGQARGWLESLVHPAVRQEVRRWLEGVRTSARPPSIAVVEAALLVETGAWRDYDRIVVVTAPLPVRRARALAGGWVPEQFDRTVAAQATDAARESVAHHVVANAGDLTTLTHAVDALWEELCAVAAAPGGLGSGDRGPGSGASSRS